MKILGFMHNLLKYMFIYALRFYKKAISPYMPHACRFVPTCSEYMMQAIEKNGIILGVYLGVKRIFRCHPFGKYGEDPVPDLRKKSTIDSHKPSD